MVFSPPFARFYHTFFRSERHHVALCTNCLLRYRALLLHLCHFPFHALKFFLALFSKSDPQHFHCIRLGEVHRIPLSFFVDHPSASLKHGAFRLLPLIFSLNFVLQLKQAEKSHRTLILLGDALFSFKLVFIVTFIHPGAVAPVISLSSQKLICHLFS